MAEIANTLSTWADNFQNNTQEMFERMKLKDWIRLVWIVGAYCLLRPYLMKLGAKMQERAHEKDAKETSAEIHPNELRGKIEIPGLEDTDEEEEEDTKETKPGEWGRTARVRQRKFIRETLEKEEQRLQAEQEVEDDKDIQEFLVD